VCVRACVCVRVFVGMWSSELLLSKSDGIEVSYNACGVIANLMSDGPAAWTVASPLRYKVLDRMVLAIGSWSLSQKRNINYRSAMMLSSVDFDMLVKEFLFFIYLFIVQSYTEYQCNKKDSQKYNLTHASSYHHSINSQ